MDILELGNIRKILDRFSLKPHFEIRLQKDSEKFEYDNWKIAFQAIPQNLIASKFIYIILKLKEDSIISMYIGKSATKNANRLMQHANGLKGIQERKTKLGGVFYERFHNRFFNTEINCPLYLLIFKWNNSKIIKNVFPFDLEVNLANAEAILISTLSSSLGEVLINHEFITRTKWATKDISLEEVNKIKYISIHGTDISSLWNEWCEKWFFSSGLLPNTEIDTKYHHVPLFETDNTNMIVNTFNTKSGKAILMKHPQMIQRITNSVKIVKQSYDYYSQLISNENRITSDSPLFTDGLVYCIYVLKSDIQKLPEFSDVQFKSDFIPIYIGKTETLGRNGGYSANLKGVDSGKNKQYFARWGNDDARHIGGLSLRFFRIPNAYPSTNYETWISIIFDSKERDKSIPKLKIPVYFQMKPWFPFNISFSKKSGLFTPELETFLIALCRNLFPDILINKHNR